MHLAICSSLDFTSDIKKLADELTQRGHTVTIPRSAVMILNGECTLDEIAKEKQSGTFAERTIRMDAIRYYFEKIKAADAIIVLNLSKNRVDNYIGGNTFLEMGFAHVLRKKIFLYNPIPDASYRDEIVGMQPIILHHNLNNIQ